MSSELWVHQLIEKQAILHPNNIAISNHEYSCSYEKLEIASNQLAHYFSQKRLIKKGDFVPIQAQKSINLIITIVAILKIGAVYIPIHEEAPDLTVRTILRHTQATLFLSNLENTPEIMAVKTVSIDDIMTLSTTSPSIAYHIPIKKEDLAYIIYTSGTTGHPKGVMVSHHNLLSTYLSWHDIYQLSPTDVHLQMAPCSFDVFFGDLVRALCSGGNLLLCDKKILLSPVKLTNLMLSHHVSCAEFVPAILRILMRYLKKHQLQLPALRLLLCGSDLWTLEEYKQVRQWLPPHARLINSYGLTEATIDSTYFEATLDELESYDLKAPVPIGKPFPHATIAILDENQQPVLPGEIGEIHIAGPSVSLGYFKRPELTNERFIKNPTFYKTGDFGTWLPDGNLQFLGRNQSHIKVNGQRIELLTLEKLLNQHPKVNTCLTYSYLDEHNKTTLGCLLLLNQVLSYAEVVDHIKQHLPGYYMPKKIYEISEIVLNSNGKIDRDIRHQKIVGELTPSQEYQNA